MPSHMPSSFASAAAGQASNRDTRGAGRGDTRGSGDWYVVLQNLDTTPGAIACQPCADSVLYVAMVMILLEYTLSWPFVGR